MKMSRGRVDLVEKTNSRECSNAIRLALTEHRAQICFGAFCEAMDVFRN